MAIREGRWDCPSCGSRAVYGRHVDCPGCGKPRPADIRFYLTDDAPAITDAGQLAEARAGADWVCEHCAASNRATLGDCRGCGAPRGSSPAQPVIDYDAADVPRSGDAPAETPAPPGPPADAPASAPSLRFEPVPAPAVADGAAGIWVERRAAVASAEELAALIPDQRPGIPLGVKLGGFAGMALMAVLAMNNVGSNASSGANFYAPPPPPLLVPVTVAAVRWEREIGIEERTIEEGTGFTLPDSAQVIGRQRTVERYDSVLTGYRTEWREVPEERTVTEYRTRTRQVSERVEAGSRTYVCGTRDLGNGYFEDRECTEPVYETRIRAEEYEEPYTRRETVTRTVRESVPVYRPEPVYGTLYRWRAPRWAQATVAIARGDTTAPAWPEPALRPNQRLGTRQERYLITLRQAGRPDREVSLSPDEWARYRPGQRLATYDDRYGYSPVLFPADSLRACVHWHAGTGPAAPDSLGCSPLPR
jgi:hypothetical protein